MKLFKHLVLTLITLFGSAGFADNEIPSDFHGIWDSNEQTCAKRFSDTRLKIGTSTIKYLESSGQLLDITESSSTSLIATFEMSGEGSTWTSVNTYLLSNENDKLTQVFDNGRKVTRIRCVAI
ncbi:hypothetical protein CS022_14050 [Veronia nyctiphanis]|uniref:Uncharacterized protein n=1 Tax=Veronia nyctiphanis TaxID=1278244 RepID=A0A4Q0YQ80_9GAMM|nr:hypothetical protein [Veronia nyctiphanis]RXJ72753.1 hypothetical protein CS022_14050 [Veronia nyctiphanis]